MTTFEEHFVTTKHTIAADTTVLKSRAASFKVGLYHALMMHYEYDVMPIEYDEDSLVRLLHHTLRLMGACGITYRKVMISSKYVADLKTNIGNMFDAIKRHVSYDAELATSRMVPGLCGILSYVHNIVAYADDGDFTELLTRSNIINDPACDETRLTDNVHMVGMITGLIGELYEIDIACDADERLDEMGDCFWYINHLAHIANPSGVLESINALVIPDDITKGTSWIVQAFVDHVWRDRALDTFNIHRACCTLLNKFEDYDIPFTKALDYNVKKLAKRYNKKPFTFKTARNVAAFKDSQ